MGPEQESNGEQEPGLGLISALDSAPDLDLDLDSVLDLDLDLDSVLDLDLDTNHRQYRNHTYS